MKNEFTKVTIYNTVKSIIENGTTEGVSGDLLYAINERMNKDIEQASKKSSGSKKLTDNDILNGEIRDEIISLLTDNGTMIYSDLVKAVQYKFSDKEISPQKITANVTKLKDKVEKFEDGKGKSKKLYIKLA